MTPEIMAAYVQPAVEAAIDEVLPTLGMFCESRRPDTLTREEEAIFNQLLKSYKHLQKAQDRIERYLEDVPTAQG